MAPFWVSDISLGEDHSVCVTLEGHLYSWGCNQWGVLGIGATPYPNEAGGNNHDYWAHPIQVTFYEGALHARVCRVAAGGCHTLCVNEYGQMYEWGRGLSSPEGASNVPWCHNGDVDMCLSDDEWLRLRSPKLVTRFVKLCIDCVVPSAVTARYISDSFEVEVLPHEMVDVVDIAAGARSKACLTSTGGEVP
jgi:alpha-tubulin suppressor-like RCC1 family protein